MNGLDDLLLYVASSPDEVRGFEVLCMYVDFPNLVICYKLIVIDIR